MFEINVKNRHPKHTQNELGAGLVHPATQISIKVAYLGRKYLIFRKIHPIGCPGWTWVQGGCTQSPSTQQNFCPGPPSLPAPSEILGLGHPGPQHPAKFSVWATQPPSTQPFFGWFRTLLRLFKHMIRNSEWLWFPASISTSSMII